MEEVNLSSVNAEPVANVEPQNNEPINEPVQTNNVEPVEPQQEPVKPVQSAEENAKYAEIRRSAETKAKDQMIAEMYGNQGITTYAQYQQAIQEQQAEEQRQKFQEENGIDPNIIDERVKQLLENHPAVQSAKEQSRTLQLNNAAMDLSKVAKSLGIDGEIKSWADVEALPKFEAIKNGIVNNNLDIITAAKLAYFDDVVNSTTTKAQQETINNIIKNQKSSTGSVSSGASEQTTGVYSMSDAEFKKMQNEVLSGQRKNIR